MKFLVIGDLHIGEAQDDPWHENIRLNLLESAYEYANTHGIKNIVYLGDIFDDRRALTHRSLEFARKNITEPIQKYGLEAIIIIGNHDAMHTNTLTPNAVSEVFGNQDNFQVVEMFETIKIGDTKVDFVSWMCDDNTHDIIDAVKNSDSKYCFGHFELVGFYYYSNIMATKGIDPMFLQKYDFVGSGHYHTINGHGNVKYLGSPFTIKHNDDNEIRGFWEFDTYDMCNPKLIPNEKIWHRSFNYPLDSSLEDFNLNIDEFKDTRVRIYLNDKPDKDFEKIESLLEANANRLRIINNYALNNAINTQMKISDEIKAEGGIKELAYANIQNNDMINDIDKEIIMNKFNTLYINAMSIKGEE